MPATAHHVFHNMSLRSALRLAAELGCRVSDVPCTDEVRVDPPDDPRPLRIKCTRKDATAQLISLLRRLSRSASPSAS